MIIQKLTCHPQWISLSMHTCNIKPREHLNENKIRLLKISFEFLFEYVHNIHVYTNDVFNRPLDILMKGIIESLAYNKVLFRMICRSNNITLSII